MPEQNHGHVDQQPVGERVGDLPELGLDVPAAGQEAVELVGDRGGREEDRRGPAVAVGRVQDQDRVDRDRDQPQDRQRVRQLRQRP